MSGLKGRFIRFRVSTMAERGFVVVLSRRFAAQIVCWLGTPG
jgi:hypothetical protein